MNLDEYKNLREAIKANARAEERKLSKSYAFEHSDVEVDDIITDHIGSIKVEKIQWTFASFSETPICVYGGTVLKKDKTPTKRYKYRKVWQTNLLP